MEPESETDELSGSGADKDSETPEDSNLEPEKYDMKQKAQSGQQSGTGNDWNSHTPEGMDPESETDELSGSDTDWDTGASGMDPGMDTGLEKDKLLGPGNDWDSGEREGKDPELATGEVSMSDTEWKSNAPENMNPESEIDNST